MITRNPLRKNAARMALTTALVAGTALGLAPTANAGTWGGSYTCALGAGNITAYGKKTGTYSVYLFATSASWTVPADYPLKTYHQRGTVRSGQWTVSGASSGWAGCS